MTMHGKGFWVGLVMGLVLAGAYGTYVLNQQVRMNHAFGAIDNSTMVKHLNVLRARFEAGEIERAAEYQEIVAWGLIQHNRYNHCVAASAWALGGSLLTRCENRLLDSISLGSAIPGLAEQRRRVEDEQAIESEQTGP